MNELKKFCLVSKKAFYFWTIFIALIILTVGYACSCMVDRIDNQSILIMSFFVVFAILCYIAARRHYVVLPRKRFEARLNYFMQQGLFDYVISDMGKSVKKLNGKLLLGEYCVMCKGSGLIVFYNEISSLYRKISTSTGDDGHTTETWSFKIDAGGKTYDLCEVNKSKQSKDDWNDIKAFLQLIAPSIRVSG